MLCIVMYTTVVQKNGFFIHTYIYFHILFRYGLSQNIDCNSLCYTVRCCCLYILVESTTPKLPIHPSSYLLPLAATSLFSVSLILSLIS